MNSTETDAFGLGSGATEPPETKTTVLLLASAMLRPAMAATVAVGLLATAFGALLLGFDGAVGAAAGTLLVVVCGWFTIAVMRWTSSAPSVVVMGAALSAYGFKCMALLTLLLVLGDTPGFDVGTFAWAILSAEVVWTLGVLAGFMRARVATITPATDDGSHTAAPHPRPADSLPLR